jgi:hypothetical protein
MIDPLRSLPLDIMCFFIPLSHCLYLSNFPPIHKFLHEYEIYILHTHTHTPVYKRRKKKFVTKMAFLSRQRNKNPPAYEIPPLIPPLIPPQIYIIYIYIIISSCFFTNLPFLFRFFF